MMADKHKPFSPTLPKKLDIIMPIYTDLALLAVSDLSFSTHQLVDLRLFFG